MNNAAAPDGFDPGVRERSLDVGYSDVASVGSGSRRVRLAGGRRREWVRLRIGIHAGGNCWNDGRGSVDLTDATDQRRHNGAGRW